MFARPTDSENESECADMLRHFFYMSSGGGGVVVIVVVVVLLRPSCSEQPMEVILLHVGKAIIYVDGYADWWQVVTLSLLSTV